MKRLALILALLALLAMPAVALADYGSYTDADGLLCTWTGLSMGGIGNYQVFCSGHHRRIQRFYQYSCSVNAYAMGSENWWCRDMYGNTWTWSG